MKIEQIHRTKRDQKQFYEEENVAQPVVDPLVQKFNPELSESQLLSTLQSIRVWEFGKTHLYYWIEILDRFDDILAAAKSSINVDNRELVLQILRFTAILIRNSSNPEIYNSLEHLQDLLE
eukprot:TRINITY_DN31719_c0_g1_i1.p2 TRINITY_DN31719_c0_g1~~TRINITY_DN31719_c0_g1_i1.p2  ORF type:complete len:121 (-),score=17.83 TRINITY_DN31719_c0_g1_i1:3-365(-)